MAGRASSGPVRQPESRGPSSMIRMKSVILPALTAFLAAAIYAIMNSEIQLLQPVKGRLWNISNNFFHPQAPSVNSTDDGWNLLYHLGGNGPWIPKTDGIGDVGDLPEGCRVDQVHMMSRHNERYPTHEAAVRMVQLLNRLHTLDHDLQGDLSFFRNWTFFMNHEDYLAEAGQLIPKGPYAGTLGAFKAGVALRTQYKDLREEALTRNQTNFWSAGSQRDIDTARNFAAGFYGVDWEKGFAKLHVVPESLDLGADTLTAGTTCKDYRSDDDGEGRGRGTNKLRKWQSVYLPPIPARLEQENPGLRLSVKEAHTMQELCGFELLARGSSPWCDIFTHDEWEQFEYARDITHYYRSGPGNKYSAAIGWPFLNATTNLLKQGPEAGSLFFSFNHDGNVLPFVTALSLFPSPEHLPTTHIPPNRSWRTSTIVPMGGRIILERVNCPAVYCRTNAPLYPNHIYCDAPADEAYVRVVINDAVVPIPGCDDGPGGTCPLGAFERRVMLRGWEVGDFGKLCGLEDGAPDRITFLHH